MLENGLGDLIKSQAQNANRIVDPFCGSGIVAWYAAEQTSKKVIASDLQMYAVVLARSVLCRTSPLQVEKLSSSWFMRANDLLHSSSVYKQAARYEQWDSNTSGAFRFSWLTLGPI